jgi:2'-hydroxyisoflavone reductase
VRVRRGGEVLAPGKPEDPVQIIDVRDLARFIVHCAEESITGAFNATGPKEPLGMGGLLEGCKEATDSDATFTWVGAEFLREQKVMPWSELPVWVPPEGGYAGFSRVSCAKAIQAGLTFRPLSETVTETLAWYDEREQKELRAGLEPEREAAVLSAWHAREGEKAEQDDNDKGGDEQVGGRRS